MTPFSWGRRGLFQCIATPKPINHRANSVGKSPSAPQGQPLSTRKRPGNPQRPKANRSCSYTAWAGTRAQVPRGENRGPQGRPAAFVDQAEPAHFFVIL